MSRYIDADKFIASLKTDKYGNADVNEIEKAIDKSRADVVEVVRCKDCKYNPSNPRSWDDDDIVEHYLWCEFMAIESKYNYCSKGKRSEE